MIHEFWLLRVGLWRSHLLWRMSDRMMHGAYMMRVAVFGFIPFRNPTVARAAVLGGR